MDPVRSNSPSRQRGGSVSANEPTVQHKSPIQTRYTQMLLQQQDDIPKRDNILVYVSTWLQLAGWVFFPNTFTHPSQAVKNATNNVTIAAAIYDSVQSVPLVVFATIFCVIGTSGVVWLWWKWNSNFVWLTRQIFLPTLVYSITGFISALTNVYTAQGGMWSITAKTTAGVTGAFAVFSTILLLLYNWLLMKVQRDHKAELNNWGHDPEKVQAESDNSGPDPETVQAESDNSGPDPETP